jgi:sterol desaturase/sphingolipid hydroxylase (fatty acid hydroxylase superfamily)
MAATSSEILPRIARRSAILLAAEFILLAWLERRRPLRRATEPKIRREARNLALGGLGAVAMQLAEIPVASRLAAITEQHRWGVLNLVRLPLWAECVAALVLMDYTMYIWHVLTHRVPFLWRFHLVHHVDLDLDASTAIRFHFGELLASVPWRAAQIFLIGLSPFTYAVWQGVFIAAIMFHHSNLRFPISVERHLVRWVVTPRMHGIHHSIIRQETNSNWSSGLAIWDRLHRTLRLDVPQRGITIGVPVYRDAAHLRLPRLIGLPFEPLPEIWILPDGTSPAPHSASASPTELLP